MFELRSADYNNIFSFKYVLGLLAIEEISENVFMGKGQKRDQDTNVDWLGVMAYHNFQHLQQT